MLIQRLLGSAVALLILVSTARAVVGPTHDEGAIELPGRSRVRIGDAERQRRLEAGPGWQGFRVRHGNWRGVWNESTESPHRAYGPPIALTGYRDDATVVDRAVRTFIHGNPEVFGPAPGLELLSARRTGDTWNVRYRQTVRGVPVLFADWDFRVGSGGRLFSFGADVERPGSDVRTLARLTGAVARESAKQGLRFDPAVDRVDGGRDLFLLPYPTEDGVEYRLVYQAEVFTSDPIGRWVTYVDAASGEVLWRRNRVRFDVSGTVTGSIHPNGPNDFQTTRPFAHQTVVVGGGGVVTDGTGMYSGPGPDPATVTASLRGPYVDVNRSDGMLEASYSTSVPNPSVHDFEWGNTANAHDAERDAFYHVNVAHDYVKELEPSFIGLDYAMPCAVNIASTCNAFWDGIGVNFFSAGGGCPNTATIPDVVYHEYGHGVNDKVYAAHGGGFMSNGALHEGMADVHASFLRDDPVIGRDFFGPGTTLRNVDNTLRWPQDASGDGHITGLIVAGAFWDLRQSAGLAVAEHLAHFSKHYVPDDDNDGVAMFEVFEATLNADDDNSNLTDGTPHSSQIIAAFNAHGIGTVFWIDLAHAPLADQPTGGDIPVTAQIGYSGPIGALDTGSPTLHYRLNNGSLTAVPMTPTENPGEYGATISAPGASVIRYYVSAADNFGQVATLPSNAPGKLNLLLVGSPTTLTTYNMETASGWLAGTAGDNATSGLWVRADPVGTYVGSIPVQPELDHSSSGVACWVTGNGAAGGQAGAADVDGGKTTLNSPVFDGVPAGNVYPMIEYYRWYSNNAGSAPGSDFWRVEISNNGGTSWVPVENTNVTDNTWARVVFRIQDFVIPTSNMKLRYIATDDGSGSLVEAAVDDFRLMAFPASLVAVDPGRPSALALAPASPNPFSARTALHFDLPAAGRATVRVFDVNGRRVKTLAETSFPAGAHTVEWDGRDESGHRLASGAYFVRLQHGGLEVVRAVVHIE